MSGAIKRGDDAGGCGGGLWQAAGAYAVPQGAVGQSGRTAPRDFGRAGEALALEEAYRLIPKDGKNTIALQAILDDSLMNSLISGKRRLSRAARGSAVRAQSPADQLALQPGERCQDAKGQLTGCHPWCRSPRLTRSDKRSP